MKTKISFLPIALVLFLISSCKENQTEMTLKGNAKNVGENKTYSNGLVLLEEYDSGILGTSKSVGSTQTDANGNFSFNYKFKSNKWYRVFLQSDKLLISGSKGYKDLEEGINFKGNNIPTKLELSCAIKTMYNVVFIHDEGSDSMFYENSLLNIDNYASQWFYDDTYEYNDSPTATGMRFFKTTKYKNGLSQTSIDTIYMEIGKVNLVEIHY